MKHISFPVFSPSVSGEHVGGSTYGFEVWDGHPNREDVLGFLQEARSRAVALRQQVASHNVRRADSRRRR